MPPSLLLSPCNPRSLGAFQLALGHARPTLISRPRDVSRPPRDDSTRTQSIKRSGSRHTQSNTHTRVVDRGPPTHRSEALVTRKLYACHPDFHPQTSAFLKQPAQSVYRLCATRRRFISDLGAIKKNCQVPTISFPFRSHQQRQTAYLSRFRFRETACYGIVTRSVHAAHPIILNATTQALNFHLSQDPAAFFAALVVPSCPLGFLRRLVHWAISGGQSSPGSFYPLPHITALAP